MALVEEFMLGETKIKIFDDYCKDKTTEEIEAILDRIAQIALNNWSNSTYQKLSQVDTHNIENQEENKD